MAIITRSPARGRAAIPEAPVGTYEAVAAKYAQEFMRAKREQEANKMSMKILQWQNGELPYDELKKYLEERIGNAKDNSSEKIELMQTLSSVKEHQTKLKELDNQQRVANKRSELLEKYKDKGISNQEALDIVEELRKVADEDSSVYQELIAEEAKIRGAIEAETSSGSEKVATNEFRNKLVEIEDAENSAELAYQQGQITGQARDTIRLYHAQELQDTISNYADIGQAVSESDLRTAQNFISGSEQLINLREQGLMADVVSEDGRIIRVATNDRNFGREITFSPTQGVQMGDIADISGAVSYNPQLMSYVVEGDNTPYPSKQKALEAAQNKGLLSFVALLPDPSTQIELVNPATGEVSYVNGTREARLSKDQNTGVFYEVDNPQNVYAVIPSTTEEIEQYSITGLPENWQGDEAINAQIKDMTTKIKGGEENIDLTINLPTTDTTQQPEEDKGFFQNILDRFSGKQDELISPIPQDQVLQETSFMDNFGGGGGGGGGGGAGGGDDFNLGKAANFAKNKIGSFFSPPQAQAAGPQIEPRGFESRGFSMPEQKSFDFKMPSFNFKMPEFQAPSFQSPSFRESVAPTMSNIKTEVSGIGSKIKDFGRRAVTGVKNFFGF